MFINSIVISFVKVSPELLRNVANIYVEHTNRFFAMTSNSPNSMDQMAGELEVSILCLKSIRRLIAHGFSDFSKVEETKVTMQITTFIDNTHS